MMERRNFLKWFPVAVVGFVGLAVNLLNKMFAYIVGPKLSPTEEAKLIEEKIASFERHSYSDKLREERLLNHKIYICNVSDLKKKSGLRFVDFNSKPALAFLGKDDKPVLISSVCTHLGCTVQTNLQNGKLYCPCHLGYFELETGKVLAGPPPQPLPMIPFVIENEKVYIVKHV